MKKTREPTPEERRLWREATKQDVKYRPVPETDESAVAIEPQAPLPEPVAMPIAVKAPRATPPLQTLSGRQASRLLKPYAPVEATLDLHGLGKIEAYGQVQDFIDRAQRAGLRHVLIITGKGREGQGILRASLPQWLNEPALRQRIIGVAHPHPGKGGTGVMHVVLKRKR